MSTAVKLLEAAADLVGGEKALAAHLGVGSSLLAKFMTGTLPLPDPLLLRAVDIVLAHRHVPFQPGPAPAAVLKNAEDLPPS